MAKRNWRAMKTRYMVLARRVADAERQCKTEDREAEKKSERSDRAARRELKKLKDRVVPVAVKIAGTDDDGTELTIEPYNRHPDDIWITSRGVEMQWCADRPNDVRHWLVTWGEIADAMEKEEAVNAE